MQILSIFLGGNFYRQNGMLTLKHILPTTFLPLLLNFFIFINLLQLFNISHHLDPKSTSFTNSHCNFLIKNWFCVVFLIFGNHQSILLDVMLQACQAFLLICFLHALRCLNLLRQAINLT